MSVIVVATSWVRNEFINGADVRGVVLCCALQCECKRALVPRRPAESIDIIPTAIQSFVQVVNIELVVWVTAAGVAPADSQLRCQCSVMQ